MESFRNRTVPLERYTTDYGPGWSTTTRSVGVGYIDQMSSTSSNGNFVDANNQSINVVRTRLYHGSWGNRSSDGRSGQDNNGTSPYNLNPVPVDLGIVGAVYNKAISRFNEKLRSELDLAVAAAEWSSTRRMLKSSYDMVSLIRRLAPKNWSRNWLEYQYGWRPLLSDIYNSAEEYVNYRRRNTLIRATAQDGEQRAVTSLLAGIPGTTERRTLFSNYRVIVQGWYDVTDSTIQKAGNWTSLNPLSIGWELVPYSFVVDWFIDVGSYLNNVETAFLYGCSFKRGFVTQGRREFTQAYAGGVSPMTTSSSYFDLKGHYLRTYKLRQRLAFSPLPRVPRFNLRMGAERMLSAAALLVQALPPGERPRYVNRLRTFSNIHWSRAGNTWRDVGTVDWREFGRGHH